MTDEESNERSDVWKAEESPPSFADIKREHEIDADEDLPRNHSIISHDSENTLSTGGDSYFADLVSQINAQKGESEWDELDSPSGGVGSRMLTDSKSQAIIELLRNTSNVLLLGPLLCPADYEIGTTLMGISDIDEVNLLLISYSQTPDERLSICRTYTKGIPGSTSIIAVGSQTRSSSSNTIETEDGSVTIESLPDPSDLKRIGITIDKILNRWQDNGKRTVICFHSITALLQFVDDPSRVFKFLSILRGRIVNNNAHAHYHMERGAHDSHLMGTLRNLFDAVITYDEAGTVTIDS